MDLTLDYWVSSTPDFGSSAGSSSDRGDRGGGGGGSGGGGGMSGGSDSKRLSSDVSKNSIKASIRHMHIQRSLGSSSSSSALDSDVGGADPTMHLQQNTFQMQYWLKEKKSKRKLEP